MRKTIILLKKKSSLHIYVKGRGIWAGEKKRLKGRRRRHEKEGKKEERREYLSKANALKNGFFFLRFSFGSKTSDTTAETDRQTDRKKEEISSRNKTASNQNTMQYVLTYILSLLLAFFLSFFLFEERDRERDLRNSPHISKNPKNSLLLLFQFSSQKK